MILASKEYDEECAKEWLNAIINERKEKENVRRDEEIQIEERKRQEEIQERRRQEVIAERKREEKIDIAGRKRQEAIQESREQQEIELRKLEYGERKRKEEYEGRKRKDEMEFELEKIRLGAEGRFSNAIANQNVNKTQIKPKLEIHHLMQKFNSDKNDISLYLIMFERLAKQSEILENTWVTHLLGLLRMTLRS
ncbi:hypothetical protein AVEN_44012-1 [Araneus ventricosus]|uniref:Uncharacterized protein n=1 Tax=Araneus ventricosus TaxID=182803 RepID=A0A4Y2R768_ARAVE|nr:hypothetical protein AVEN_44012-1 [Araneus ventricosus]